MGDVNGNFNGELNVTIEKEARVHDWETGLPDVDDITPLTHNLIPPNLLLAFNIKPDPCRTHNDVIQASEDTISAIRAQSTSNFNPHEGACDPRADEDEGEPSNGKYLRRNGSPENSPDKGQKRQRLVWTPQLHRRFVEVVGRLGIKNAVPKTIMQLMNVEGLTRENVASHLQKYRLFLKRNQGFSFDGAPASSLENVPENGGPVTFGSVPMMGHGHMGMMSCNNNGGFDSSHHRDDNDFGYHDQGSSYGGYSGKA